MTHAARLRIMARSLGRPDLLESVLLVLDVIEAAEKLNSILCEDDFERSEDLDTFVEFGSSLLAANAEAE